MYVLDFYIAFAHNIATLLFVNYAEFKNVVYPLCYRSEVRCKTITHISSANLFKIEVKRKQVIISNHLLTNCIQETSVCPVSRSISEQQPHKLFLW